jgi:hypothetical protein
MAMFFKKTRTVLLISVTILPTHGKKRLNQLLIVMLNRETEATSGRLTITMQPVGQQVQPADRQEQPLGRQEQRVDQQVQLDQQVQPGQQVQPDRQVEVREGEAK